MANYIGYQLGNYRLISLIGQGGFADVYLGEHIYLNTQAAIKVLQMRLVGSNLEQFRNEARTIASLNHPNVVRILDFGVADSIPYLVMEYAPNGTLRQRHPKGIPLSPLSIVPYLQQATDALQYAHNRKLIHRDIKPENMLLGANNQVLLSDFGLVLIAQSTGSQSVKEMGGTVPYMAPEQLQGRPRPASDQYALGVVVYEWLCGDRPFHGTFTEVASQHMFAPPPALRSKIPGISPKIEQVILKALAKDPQQRFADIKAFATTYEESCQALQPYPHFHTFSTVQMDQSSVIQPGQAKQQPTPVLPLLSQSAQSTIVNTPSDKTSLPAVMNTPQHQLSQFTNMAQPGKQSQPSIVVTPSNQFTHPNVMNNMPDQVSPPVLPYIAPQEAGFSLSGSRRRRWKWPMVAVISIVILAMVVLLPLVRGLVTSNSTIARSRTPSTLVTTLPGQTLTSLPKPTVTPSPKATPTPLPTSIAVTLPTPTPTPVPPTPTPPSGPGVTPGSLSPNQCPVTSQGWTCVVTLSEAQNSSGQLRWSAPPDSAGATFNPARGTLSPGQTVQVSIAIPLADCSDTFTFTGPVSTANETWNCTLSAPVQLSPASGTVFNNYPRTTTVTWSAVPGAASYTVQVYYYQPGDTTCSGGAPNYLTPNITGTSYTFNFVGAQPGCWRVWAVDAAGRQGSSSAWWEFSYTI